MSPFLISKYLVTYSQFQAFIDAPDGWRNKEWWRFSEGAYKWRASRQAPSDAYWPIANRPRERVCWYEAIAYCAWLSNKLDPDVFKINDVTTWSVRLPSEAEWQAAASQKLEYCWGPLYLSLIHI